MRHHHKELFESLEAKRKKGKAIRGEMIGIGSDYAVLYNAALFINKIFSNSSPLDELTVIALIRGNVLIEGISHEDAMGLERFSHELDKFRPRVPIDHTFSFDLQDEPNIPPKTAQKVEAVKKPQVPESFTANKVRGQKIWKEQRMNDPVKVRNASDESTAITKSAEENMRKYERDLALRTAESQFVTPFIPDTPEGAVEHTDETHSLEEIRRLAKNLGIMPVGSQNEAPFYMVYVENGRNPCKKHGSYGEALEEAERLCKLENKKAFVMRPITEVDLEITIKSREVWVEKS